MQLKTNNLRFIIKTVTVIAVLFACSGLMAQEVIDTTEIASATVKDTVKPAKSQGFKVDGVAAVVGKYVILDSDISQALASLKSQGVTDDVNKCQLLDKLMEDKLYAHQAVVDSIDVPESQVRSYTDQQIAYFLQQFNGSEERLLKFYRKEKMEDLDKELYELNMNQELAKAMQQKIVEDIEIIFQTGIFDSASPRI